MAAEEVTWSTECDQCAWVSAEYLSIHGASAAFTAHMRVAHDG